MRTGEPKTRWRPARHVRLGSAARREAILEGARRALIAGGLAGTTMDDVAAAAGVAKGTPYLYFSSKADLIETIRLEYGMDLLAQGGGVLFCGGRMQGRAPARAPVDPGSRSPMRGRD